MKPLSAHCSVSIGLVAFINGAVGGVVIQSYCSVGAYGDTHVNVTCMGLR